jgi:hypothetical protein
MFRQGKEGTMTRICRYVAMWAAAALLTLGAAIPVAGGTETGNGITHRVELTTGGRSVAVIQRFVETAEGIDLHLIAEGPNTGSTTAAVIYANGSVKFAAGADRAAWWKDFFAGNGITGSAEVGVRDEGGRATVDLFVKGVGAGHVITSGLFDIDEPWGPCPGPDDAPCIGPAIVIDFPCIFDVDQCSGGPQGFAQRRVSSEGIDPDGDPAISLGVIRMRYDHAVLRRGFGTTILSLDNGRFFEHREP